MNDWLWKVSANAAGKLLAQLIAGLACGSELGVAILSSWQYLIAAPWPVVVLVCFGIVATVLFVACAVAAILYSPIGPGVYGSKYLLWYKSPIRKVSWNFFQVLGASSGLGHPVVIHTFQAEFRVNRGEGIAPKKAFLECKRTGVSQDVLISPLDSYVKAEDVAFIPSGRWFQCQSQVGGMSKETFLQKYDGFTFVFEYDDEMFHRHFSRREVEEWIDRFWRYSNPCPEPRGTIRG